MVGFIYRRAVNLKNIGERLGRIRVFGKRPFTTASSLFIRMGLALRGRIGKYPINQKIIF